MDHIRAVLPCGASCQRHARRQEQQQRLPARQDKIITFLPLAFLPFAAFAEGDENLSPSGTPHSEDAQPKRSGRASERRLRVKRGDTWGRKVVKNADSNKAPRFREKYQAEKKKTKKFV
ncbi:MAG: hypothetical protein B6D45_05205 [Ignavibacteriales bacterium UTCHB3]|nr:MAG: hypothetical protein B6D45_05205 [Ignavibacteriales bacterium UTCHB3]